MSRSRLSGHPWLVRTRGSASRPVAKALLKLCCMCHRRYPVLMVRQFRHRYSLVLRLGMLAMLVLLLVAKPVLASVGEVHELAHEPTGTHSQIIDDATEVASEADRSGSAVTLHVLLEFAHCCGQSTTLALSALVLPLHYLIGLPLPAVEAQILSGDHTLAPFRPPIVM